MTIGYYQNEIRDLRGNALVNAVVAVFNVGTTTPATIYSDAAGTVSMVASPLPAAAGLNLPGKDVAANIAFFADAAVDYDIRVTDTGGTFTFRARLAPGPIPPGTYVEPTSTGVRTAAYDRFLRSNRAVDGDTAESGQIYTSAGAGAIVSNQLSATGSGQASYNRLNIGAAMRAMSCKFVLTGGTGDVGIALVNTADGTGNASTLILGNNWLHLSVSRVGWGLSWTTNAVLGGSITFNMIDSFDFPTPLARGGAVYGASMEIIGDRAVITIWNDTTGQVISTRVTKSDSHFVSFLGNYCIWEPITANGGVGGSAIVNLSATTKVSPLDTPVMTRGDVAALLAAGLADPLGLGYATNVPPWSVGKTPMTFDGANWAWINKLLADSLPNAGHIKLQVAVSSGNICAGVYRLKESGQIVRIATTGAIACPAAGEANIALTAPVSAFRATDYLALAVDNTTASFYGATGYGIVTGGTGTGLMTGAMPLPAGPIGPSWVASGAFPLMVLTA